VKRLVRADAQALQRRRSLRGFLEAADYAVVAEAPQLVGGYTVRSYGSHHSDGLDAIQIEIILELRECRSERETLIENLAQAIARLVVLWADAHSVAAFRSIDLVTGESAAAVAGQLRPDADTGDWVLGSGGQPRNRGRLEIGRDPGAGVSSRRAGVLAHPLPEHVDPGALDIPPKSLPANSVRSITFRVGW
jgi:hypothetical protein